MPSAPDNTTFDLYFYGPKNYLHATYTTLASLTGVLSLTSSQNISIGSNTIVLNQTDSYVNTIT